MTQVDQTTHQNASLVEETSAAAEELAAQASGLLDVVSFFKIGNGATKQRSTVRIQPIKNSAALGGGRKMSLSSGKPASLSQNTGSGAQDDFSEF
jgi:methyl-accepting chemotaxis protein